MADIGTTFVGFTAGDFEYLTTYTAIKDFLDGKLDTITVEGVTYYVFKDDYDMDFIDLLEEEGIDFENFLYFKYLKSTWNLVPGI